MELVAPAPCPLLFPGRTDVGSLLRLMVEPRSPESHSLWTGPRRPHKSVGEFSFFFLDRS